jgi:hypothetical protein
MKGHQGTVEGLPTAKVLSILRGMPRKK